MYISDGHSHTVVSGAAGVAQADLSVASDRVNQRADAGVVGGLAGRVLSDRVGDTLGTASRHELADAESGSHSGESRQGKNSDGRHCDGVRCCMSCCVLVNECGQILVQRSRTEDRRTGARSFFIGRKSVFV